MNQEWVEFLALFGSVGILIWVSIKLGKYWDRFKDKFRSMGFELEYQLELLSALIVMGLAFVFFAPVIGWMMRNFWGLGGFLVALCYPLLIMILRPSVFEKVMNIIPDLGVYRVFVVFSVVAGGYFMIGGFSSLNFNNPLGLSLSIILLGFIGQAVPLFPDVIEKATSIDMGMNRTRAMSSADSKKAMIVIGVLSVITFFVLRFVSLNIQSTIFGI